MTRKSPTFAGQAFLFRVIYAEVIGASNKEEKHDRTVYPGRKRTGIASAQAGNWCEFCAWTEWVSR
jgi:hypothetical protein